MPATVEFLALQRECQVALGQTAVGVAFSQPMATIPDHDRAAPILTLRNGPFEFVVGDRVIFDLDSQAFFSRYQTRPARHCPAFHYPVEFETQIIVQASCGVLLNDKSTATFARHLAFRLSGDTEIAFGPVSLKS